MNVLKELANRLRVRNPYRTKSYIDGYRTLMDQRVDADPHDAVGGRWEEIGELQFSFLVSKGLRPAHGLLDIGCGTLRGGRRFIRYLEPGNYTGIDISPKALDHARLLVEDEGLAGKRPDLILNTDGNMRFDGIDGMFDYVLAQSVFTHLPEAFIVECFDNLHKVLGGTFYFTIFAGERAQPAELNFFYPVNWFRELAESRGYAFRNCAADYRHPVDQVMLAASRKRR